MKTKLLLLLLWAWSCGTTISTLARETLVAQTVSATNDEVKPDVLVTNDGDVIQVFHLDYSSADYCYYTLSMDSNADLKRIAKKDVLIIKLSDGTKIDLSAATTVVPLAPTSTTSVPVKRAMPQRHNDHPAVTHQATGSTQDKQGNDVLVVEDGSGQTLYMQEVVGEDRALVVVKPTGKMKEYKAKKYIIPEYVTFNGVIYSVRYIGEKAFSWGSLEEIQLPQTLFAINDCAFMWSKLRRITLPDSLTVVGTYAFGNARSLVEVIFPETLEQIKDRAFDGTEITRVALPENIQVIGNYAFTLVNTRGTNEELYIPKGVKTIGANAFLRLGKDTSPRGFYQGYVTCLPDFITTGNCQSFGIDEEAVETYRNSHQ